MVEPTGERDPLEELAEEFVGRYRRGERPSLTEYASRHPHLADRVRELFPALVLMEQIGPEPGASARPDHLGEYRIVREVGRGGMGVVYEAIQETLGRRVALKILPAERARGQFLERFWHEARAAAKLHHTNIVPVFGVGEHDGTHYYVMQYIDGRGLDQVLREVGRLRDSPPPPTAVGNTPGHDTPSELAFSLVAGQFKADSLTDPTDGAATSPQPPAGGTYARMVARLGVQAASALDHAHGQGVLHRDVKPSNLLLDAQGTLWVADFGLAKTEETAGLTNTHDLVGTLRYMAPERFRGRADARSDVYSLGATLYELLGLRPAFDGHDRLRLMDQIARGAPARLREVNPGVPRDLETIICKAMACDPAERYPTAGELADDLERFLADRTIRARRAGLWEIGVRWAKRRPAVAGLVAAVAVLLVLTAVGGWWAAGRLRDQVQTVSKAEMEKTERLWEARLAQARAGRASRLPGQRYKSLDALAEAAAIRPSLELRNEAVACLALMDLRPERQWPEALQTDRLEYSTGATFDPDLDTYAFTDAAGTVHVHSAEDGRALARLGGARGPADYLSFSPDGRYLAARYTQDAKPLLVWDWRSGRLVLELPHPGAQLPAFAFRPDGQAIAVGGSRRADVYGLPGGERTKTVPLDFDPGCLAYEPQDGRTLAVCGDDTPRLAVLEADTGRVILTWRPPAMLYAVAWQPGGSLLAASGRDGAVYPFDVAAQGPRQPLLGHLLEARELAFSPDGSVLVSRAWDATTRLWDPHTGTELLRVRGASFLQFSRDGRRLAYRGYNSRELGIWRLPRPEVKVLHGALAVDPRTIRRRDLRWPRGHVLNSPPSPAPQPHAGLSFGPGGRLLAVAARDGISLWDARAGRLLARLDTGPAKDALIDPRGRWLLTAGDRGVFQFPLSRSAGEASELWQVGPPRTVLPAGLHQPFQLHCDRNGDHFLVVDRGTQVLVYRADDPGAPPVRLWGHANVSYAALSPDGRRVATGTWRGAGVRIWDALSGGVVSALPARESAGVVFTPDGGRLLVLESEGAYRCFRAPDWTLEAQGHDPDTGFTRGLRAAIHPNGRVMAQTKDRVNLRLVDLDTGEELAVLPVPESQNLAAYQFSPDGRYLAAVTVRGVVQLWDLRSLRTRLRELGLDWVPHDVPPALDTGRVRPLRVTVVGETEY
jgi:serine/threonine protein kinase/WD40 repeat protein